MAGPLIGRADELQAVLGLLADPGVRAVVLAGPSGVGKTKLALAACRGVGTRPPGLVVPLSAVREGEVMADAVVAALGPPRHSRSDPPTPCGGRIAGTRCCSLLDNLEQVHGAARGRAGAARGLPGGHRCWRTSLGELGVPESGSCGWDRCRSAGTGPTDSSRRRCEMFVERALTRDVTHPPSEADLRAAGRDLPCRRWAPAGDRAGRRPRGVDAAQPDGRAAFGAHRAAPARPRAGGLPGTAPEPVRRPRLDRRPAARSGRRTACGDVGVRGSRHPRGGSPRWRPPT